MKRELARNDLFYLLVFVLKRKDAAREWIYQRCREVQYEPNGYLDLWAREHYKSTIITFARTIQDILNDPEITIGIFSNTRDLAQQFLRQIKLELEDNGDLKSLFPDILYSDPKKMSPKWSEGDGIIVKRNGNPKEATVEAWGIIDQQPTSKHFFLRIYDDMVTQESVGNPDIMKKTTERWELSDNLGVEGGWERYIGTTYHFHDTYAEMKKRKTVKVRQYPATDNGKVTGKGVLMSTEWLEKKRAKQGPYTFSAQMLLDPLGDDAKSFDEEWLCYWEPSRKGLNVYIIVDPASGKKRYRAGKLVNDYTCILVIGVDGNGNWLVLDMVRDRLNLQRRTEELFRLHRKYRPIQQVGYEEFGMQADIEHIEYVQKLENYRFKITPLGTNQKSKNDVIESVQPKWEQGGIILPHKIRIVNAEGKTEDLIKTFLDEEYRAYPVLKHDDTLNCFGLMNDDKMKIKVPSQGRSAAVAAAARARRQKPRTLMAL